MRRDFTFTSTSTLPSALPCVRHDLSPNPPNPVATSQSHLLVCSYTLHTHRLQTSSFVCDLVIACSAASFLYRARLEARRCTACPPALSGPLSDRFNLVRTRGIYHPARHNTATRGLEITTAHPVTNCSSPRACGSTSESFATDSTRPDWTTFAPA